MRLIYTALLYLGLPLALIRLWWRGLRNPAYRRRWRERLGSVARPADGPVIWVHAVSVGEAQAAQPLIRRLLRDYPEYSVLVTTTTPTGRDQVARLFSDAVEHRYFPFDLPGIVRRYLAQVDPALVLVMETEIWPNLAAECARRAIPLMLVNGRLSARSARGYARVRALMAETLQHFDRLAVQTPADAERQVSLGASRQRVDVTGHLKFDIRLAASVAEQAEVLRLSWGLDRPVWVAASTHEGEEQQVLAAHARLLKQFPRALLLLVPRHPERFEPVAELIRRQGYALRRRSVDSLSGDDFQVFLGDTMGELPVFLGAGDMAFMGGSLVPVGGHNLLEPAALGVPVVFGPHMFNFAAISELFLNQRAAIQVADADALAEVLARCLGDAERRAQIGEAGRRLVAENRGALDRTLDEVRALLPPGSGAR